MLLTSLFYNVFNGIKNELLKKNH